MKNIKFIIVTFSLILLYSCASTIQTTTTKTYPPTPVNEPIVVYGLNDAVPASSVNIGTIKIGDSGFSTNCGWNQVINKAKNEARKKGGTGIKLISIREPSAASTCYRISAYILKSPDKKYLTVSEQKTGYSESKLKSEWSSNGIDDIEGIYEKIGDGQSSKYTLAVKKNTNNEYSLIYLKGVLEQYSHKWQEGDLKGKLFKTATPNFYKVEWIMADKSVHDNLYISFDKGMMKIVWSENGKEEIYLKLYPTSESVLASINPEIIGSGTGFALNDQGYIVTNNHVIEDSKQIEVRGINSDFSIAYVAEVVLRDKNNDLAILKINDSRISSFDSPPFIFKESLSEVGESVFALGYPLRATMGDEVKLTNGIISSRTGFQSDITNYQVSVPVQPGNSGGPLLDSKGNIIAIISAKHLGAENASYAIKASYLFNLIELSGSNIEMNNINKLSNLDFPSQVKKIRKFVYIIECK